jgi:hypothetical protein
MIERGATRSAMIELDYRHPAIQACKAGLTKRGPQPQDLRPPRSSRPENSPFTEPSQSFSKPSLLTPLSGDESRSKKILQLS